MDSLQQGHSAGGAGVRIHRIRTGAKANYMVGVANTLGVSREMIFSLLGLLTPTANRKIAKGETLEIPVTERLVRLAIVEQDAEETFGDSKLARQWLLSDNVGLGGCSPLSMLDTDVGAREVAKVLVTIAYGVVVCGPRKNAMRLMESGWAASLKAVAGINWGNR